MRKLLYIFLTFLGVIFSLQAVYQYATIREVNAVVESKERIEGTGYLAFTNRGVYKNVDSLWFLKFNSSDVYGKLKEGALCKLTVNGLRVPLSSQYPNILSANCG